MFNEKRFLPNSRCSFANVLHHIPHSSEHFSALKAKLSDLTHAYCGNPVDIDDFLILKDCTQASRSSDAMKISMSLNLKRVLGLNKSDYISKCILFYKTALNLKILALLPKLTTLQRLKLIFKDGYFNSRKKAFFHPRFTTTFDQLVLIGPKCMVWQKFTSKMYPYVPYCK